ncbi:HEAT repeat domain-containing protein [Porphyrobacter sp. YT40]|uniref:HEAT repeat domain-containing protein n=1 Tax=Porphyrobacter sp. YT40 TaxID=2547601 RepID=UPI001141AB69|nr:HEAT repeat domain-containing protein [Porphyrobacter sp. YT40]QDH33920.1 HEAT repeat domain-containing protein [Porphyrobacter sp. YT40]
MSALLVFIVSAAAALVMVMLFGILLLRRWYQERRQQSDRANLAAITRSYMRRVAGQIDEDASAKWSDDLRLAAVSHIHLLLRGGERHRLMQMAELDGLLRATLARSRSWRTARRIDAIRLLQQFGSEACIARLREIFSRDRSMAARLEAAFALAAVYALPPPRETIRLLGIFERKVNRLDRALFRASAPDYPEQMALLLDDPISNEHRALIIDALGWSSDANALPLLEAASRSEYPEIRSAALQAAAQLALPSVEPWVMERLQDPVDFVRLQAANCCASLGLNDAIPALHLLLEDESLWVRLRAEHALEVLQYQWLNLDAKGLLA